MDSAVTFNGEVQSNNAFKAFDNSADGYRAMMVIIYSNILKGRNTISQILTQYAPPANNPTANYISYVSGKMGVDANQPLGSGFYANDNSGITGMVAAMTQFEGNIPDTVALSEGFNIFMNDYKPS